MKPPRLRRPFGAVPALASRARRAGRDRVTRLTRSLRLRAGRLHYIDHPLFGAPLTVERLR